MSALGLWLAASVSALACDAEHDQRPPYVPPASDDGVPGDDGASEDSDGDTAGAGLGDCAEVEVELHTVSPTIVVLVDRSWSMTEDFAGAERWGAVYRTLLHPDTGVVTRLQSQVEFGLTLFTSKNGNDGGECPILTEVEPLLDGAEAIDAVLASKRPVDEGPTGAALAMTASALADRPTTGPKAIVLATDGEPDTCDQPNPDEGQPEALDAAALAYELGIETFVVSVGDDVSEEHLQRMANVGVGRPADSPDAAPYYKALDHAELVAAFDDVVSALVRCDATIEGMVDPDKVCTGTVRLDGQALECGVDFELADAQTLVLKGSACEALKAGGTHALEGAWPCDAVHIP
ncbi:MAG: vWA domain-containing protein [Myxococcota bacterium]